MSKGKKFVPMKVSVNERAFKLAEKKAKRLAKEGPEKEESKSKTLDASKPITLDFLTNPEKE